MAKNPNDVTTEHLLGLIERLHNGQLELIKAVNDLAKEVRKLTHRTNPNDLTVPIKEAEPRIVQGTEDFPPCGSVKAHQCRRDRKLTKSWPVRAKSWERAGKL
jgi:hypothetical protein